ncbi:serine hydrolase domain-containing protein [Legionella hackeliae]|uniref:Beta-lactamase-related domain-containing protein n=1 Tax=Legionella hackeliae TaxID=449 RepID=A0A0A8UQ66_LEGHA|nr:serine hydrolase domain-containing protein [Legionella hackeliae]KTD10126.1 putative secreted esterase [Legionella hackeliae]CEK09616.1 protein of unknown function [Legionella hackeliae]STX49531.1 Beta-lactamase [Legionella hackeliae]
MKERQELMKELLANANIPALSLSWCQKETRHAMAYGETDTKAPSQVNTHTLFQAASLSKPVSAAIVLDLVEQDLNKDLPDKWDLDTPLFKYSSFGPPELEKDPNYQKLTMRMVIGQCSGLANFGQDGDDGKKFIATPNSRFTYSGVALDFLKEVIEKKTGKEWEAIAQDFFIKAGMKSSTFKRLPASPLVASAHKEDTNGALQPLPVVPDNSPGVPAGSLLTTAEDYITFLQYCFKNEFLKSKLLTGTLSSLPPTSSPTSQVQWGLGMGVYSDSNLKKTIAFHWGNNTGSISFCAMDMATGDCVVSLANSINGPSVFQQVAEPIVGDMSQLFEWLSKYCGFNDESRPKAPDAIASTVRSIHSLAKTDSVDNGVKITAHFKQGVRQLQKSDIASTVSDDPDTSTVINP